MGTADPGSARWTGVTSARQRTVHLDASFLIQALVPFSVEALALRTWLRQGRAIAMSAVSWGEFLCGPLADEERALALRIVLRHIPVGTAEANEAVRLFHATGRKRGSYQDCLVAATALGAEAELATANQDVFAPFEAYGVMLAR